MKKIGRYNDLSDEFLKSLNVKQLLPGKTATFRTTLGRIDPADKTKKKMIYPPSFKIPPTDMIYDTVKNQMVEIGLVKAIDQHGNATDYVRKWADINPANGEFQLHGSRQEDRDLYVYMQLTNYNSKKKDRFTNEEPLFYEVDVAGEAKKKNERRSKRLEIEIYVNALGEKDLRMIGNSIGVPSADSLDTEVLRSQIWEYAEANVETFEKLTQDGKSIESKAVIKRAFDYGILEFNEVERKVIFAGNEIATLVRVEGKKEHEQLDDYLKTTKTGYKIYESIKKLVAQQQAN